MKFQTLQQSLKGTGGRTDQNDSGWRVHFHDITSPCWLEREMQIVARCGTGSSRGGRALYDIISALPD